VADSWPEADTILGLGVFDSASEVMTLRRYTNLFIIIIIMSLISMAKAASDAFG